MKNRNMFLKMSIFFLFCAAMCIGCSEDLVEDKENTSSPVITEFYPKSGKVGTEVTIKGENLSKIDTTSIGEGLARIKYLVNSSEMVVVITSDVKTGKVKISGLFGETESSDVFTVTYVTPAINMATFPTSGKANDEILIEGENMDAVTKVHFGTTEAIVISKNEKELTVKVPYFEDNEVDIFLTYNNETGEQKTGTSGKPFSLEKPKPEISNYPSSAETGATIELIGTNLSLVDKIMFDGYEGQITLKSETSISVVVPTNYTTSSNTVVLKLIYYGTKELIVTETFEAVVPQIYFWENKTIYAQDPANTENFFDALTGKIYTPCDYATIKDNIYFYITITSNSLAINNPNNGANQIKNFKCGTSSLPSEAGSKIVKFRRLDPSNAAENEFITKVKAKTLKSISQADITTAGITNAGTSSFRHYGDPSTNMYAEGDVVLVHQFNSAGDVLKVGFLEIKKITSTNPTTDKTSSVTFNCYFEK
ncbi:MAG: IPT/TIG domain-containing protein [Dysgonomonas sp.]